MRRRHLSLVVALTATTSLLFAPAARAYDVDTVSFLLSLKSTAELDRIGGGEVTVKNEDIVFYDIEANDGAGAYEIYIDGSNVGIDGTIDAFTVLNPEPEGPPGVLATFLMSFAADEKLPGLPEVDDSDVVVFSASSFGENNTEGAFDLFLAGEDIGLTTGGEDIDALDFQDGGDPEEFFPDELFFSTTGSFSLPNPGGPPVTVGGRDEDIVRCVITAAEPGVCDVVEVFFDGSANNLGGSGEDIDAFSRRIRGDISDEAFELTMSFADNFKTPTQAGQDQDIVSCLGGTFDTDPKTCRESDEDGQDFDLFFTGHTNGITGDINSIHTSNHFGTLPLPGMP